MRTFSILLLTVIPLLSIGQTYSSKIADSTILAFMKWEMENGKSFSEASKFRMNKKTSKVILTYDTLNFFLPDNVHQGDWQNELFLFNRRTKIDTLFSASEKDSLFAQYLAISNTVWSHRMNGAKLKKWHNPKNTYHYSIPLFSSDGKYVFIKKSFYCGKVCAYGGVYLYECVDNQSWKLIEILNGWMS